MYESDDEQSKRDIFPMKIFGNMDIYVLICNQIYFQSSELLGFFNSLLKINTGNLRNTVSRTV